MTSKELKIIEYSSVNRKPIFNEAKDIEEELDIDLITLFKALKGIWVRDENKKIYYVGSPYLCYAENDERELEFQFRVGDTWYAIKDYKKTWSLTKEELEK